MRLTAGRTRVVRFTLRDQIFGSLQDSFSAAPILPPLRSIPGAGKFPRRPDKRHTRNEMATGYS